MVRHLFGLAILYAVMTSGAGLSAANLVEGLHGGAAEAIATEISKGAIADPVTAHVFYGDMTGTGANDAVVFHYHPSGGNSDRLTTHTIDGGQHFKLYECYGCDDLRRSGAGLGNCMDVLLMPDIYR